LAVPRQRVSVIRFAGTGPGMGCGFQRATLLEKFRKNEDPVYSAASANPVKKTLHGENCP